MKKYFILIVILLSSCSQNLSNDKIRNSYIFTDEMTFEEFKLKLEDYAKNSPYPNPDD